MDKFAKKFLITITLFSFQLHSNDEHVSSPELSKVAIEKKKSKQDLEKEKQQGINKYLNKLRSIYPYAASIISGIAGLMIFNELRDGSLQTQEINSIRGIDKYEDEIGELNFVKTDIKDISGSVPTKIDKFIKQINEPIIGNEIKEDYCNRMILYGPTGNGKTLLAHKIAEATNSEFIEIYVSSIFTKFVAAGSNKINETFETAINKNKKVVIFIDGINIFTMQNKFSNGIDPDEKTLDTLCAWLEKTKNNPNIIFLGESFPIDSFTKTKLEKLFKPNMVEILNPNAKMREEVINFYVKEINLKFSPNFRLYEKEISTIVSKTFGMSIRAITAIVYCLYRQPDRSIDDVILSFKPKIQVTPTIQVPNGSLTMTRVQAHQITAEGKIITVG